MWQKLQGITGRILNSNTVSVAASQYIAVSIGFFYNLVLARSLGPSEYGTVALVMAYPTLIWTFLSVKPMTVTAKYIAQFRTSRQPLEILSICKVSYGLDLLSAILTVIIVLVSGRWVVINIYKMPSLYWLTVGYSFEFLFLALVGTSQAILSSWNKFRWLSIFTILSKVITFVLVLPCLLNNLGVPGVILGTVAGELLTGLAIFCLATYLMYRQCMGFWWQSSFNQLTLISKEVSGLFSWNYLLVTLTGLTAQVPLMLLGRYRSVEEVGYYRLATSLVTASSYLEKAIGQVLYPTLCSRLVNENWVKIRKSLKQLTLERGIPLSLFLFLAILLIPTLIQELFGNYYIPMIRGTQIMILATAIRTCFYWLNPCYYALGKIKLWTKGYSVYAAFTLCGAWLLIPQAGFYGWSYIFSFSTIGFIFLMLFLLLRYQNELFCL
jgi:O-antigen/teichoic acid export membrane protein